MTDDERAKLFPVEEEPDSCDIYVQNGPVVWIFHVSRVVPKYGALDSLAGVDWEAVNPSQPETGLPRRRVAPMHVNWRSGSSIESFERRLRGYFDPTKKLGLPWGELLQAVAEKLDEFIYQGGQLRSGEWQENVPPREYIIYPIWPKSTRPVVWFGQGETLKGTIAVGAGFSACNGINFANLRTQDLRKGIVYVDYEDDFEEFSRRMSRYANGLDVAPNELFYHFDPRGRLFIDVIEQLKGMVKKLGGVDGYMIDSAIPACGGDVNKPEPVGAFFHALASLRTPSVILAHETKEGNDDFPFGSQLWRTEPAMNVNFQTGADGARKDIHGNWVRDVLLRCKKANNVPRFQPLAFQAEFTDDESPGPRIARPASTWIRQIAPTTVSLDLQGKLPPLQRIIATMKGAPAMLAKDIAEATGLPLKDVQNHLARNSRLFMSEGGGRGRGNAAHWLLIEGSAS